MKKYIKHIISFLLIIGLTINVCSIHSQTNSSNYYQVSHLNSRNESSNSYNKIYVFRRYFLKKNALVPPTSYLKLRDIHNLLVKNIFKTYISLHQKISLRIAQHIFLNKKIVSSNHFSSLYIA
ncbi:conserved hypothetical protein [Tenacibaculum xiamenense]